MNRQTTTIILLMTVLSIALSMSYVFALPTGASIVTNSTAGTPNPTAGNRSDARGTITTIILDALQQDQNWKAYVGNVTGKLSLDDAAGNTIYDWAISAINKSGQVYISRASSPVFTNVSCVNTSNIDSEQLFHNMSAGQSDSINRTFNATNHQGFFIGSQSILLNSCKSTATYRLDVPQAIDGNQVFQELILQDSSNDLIFVTIISSNTAGYDNRTYDFQAIVPESAIKAAPTTYYFFTQLNG